MKNTVGKQLDGKTPKTASTLMILDPACGSGSLLLGAYKYLLTGTWNGIPRPSAFLEKGEPETSPIIRKLLPSDYILESPNGERRRGRKKKRRQVSSLPIYQCQSNVWRLTSDEKMRSRRVQATPPWVVNAPVDGDVINWPTKPLVVAIYRLLYMRQKAADAPY